MRNENGIDSVCGSPVFAELLPLELKCFLQDFQKKPDFCPVFPPVLDSSRGLHESAASETNARNAFQGDSLPTGSRDSTSGSVALFICVFIPSGRATSPFADERTSRCC
jgi:hypothetical protein